MEILALTLLKTLASTCLKFYLGYLFTSGGIQADKGDLGYNIPSWYMNPGRQATSFYSYGTSVEGDEFASIEDARQQAVNQMATLIRRSHQRIITEEIRYDQSNIKQRRLVDLFLRGEELDTFILNHASLDKKSIVKVKKGTPPELRAFVRLKLDVDDYLSNQDATLSELRKKLTYQKSEDIMEEMDAEIRKQDTPEPPGDSPIPPVDTPTPAATTEESPLQAEVAPVPPAIPPPPMPVAPSGSVFDAMENELESIK